LVAWCHMTRDKLLCNLLGSDPQSACALRRRDKSQRDLRKSVFCLRQKPGRTTLASTG